MNFQVVIRRVHKENRESVAISGENRRRQDNSVCVKNLFADKKIGKNRCLSASGEKVLSEEKKIGRRACEITRNTVLSIEGLAEGGMT